MGHEFNKGVHHEYNEIMSHAFMVADFMLAAADFIGYDLTVIFKTHTLTTRPRLRPISAPITTPVHTRTATCARRSSLPDNFPTATGAAQARLLVVA